MSRIQPKIRINIRLYQATKERLEATAIDLGVSQTDVMELALREFMSMSTKIKQVNMTPFNKTEIRAILKLAVKLAIDVKMTKKEFDVAVESAWKNADGEKFP